MAGPGPGRSAIGQRAPGCAAAAPSEVRPRNSPLLADQFAHLLVAVLLAPDPHQ